MALRRLKTQGQGRSELEDGISTASSRFENQNGTPEGACTPSSGAAPRATRHKRKWLPLGRDTWGPEARPQSKSHAWDGLVLSVAQAIFNCLYQNCLWPKKRGWGKQTCASEPVWGTPPRAVTGFTVTGFPSSRRARILLAVLGSPTLVTRVGHQLSRKVGREVSHAPML